MSSYKEESMNDGCTNTPKYQYGALQYLDQDVRNINIYNRFTLCIYTVNNTNQYPFLQFLFCKNTLTNSIAFPYYHLLSFEKDYVDIMEIKNYILLLLKKNTIKELTGNCIDFDGFLEDGVCNYLFFHIPDLEYDLHLYDTISSNFMIGLGMIDEIVNHGFIGENEIDPNIGYFMKRNPEFMYLKDEKEENFPIPIVGYVFKPHKWFEFTHMFGQPPENGEVGYHYYFTNYEKAKEQCNESSLRKEYGGGIIKFALFTGKSKIFIDNNNNDTDKEKWQETNDSCFYIEDKKPIWVIKNYNQQVPL